MYTRITVVAVTCSTLQINIMERDLLTHHFHVTVPGLTAGVLYHYDELHPGVGSIAITRGWSQTVKEYMQWKVEQNNG